VPHADDLTTGASFGVAAAICLVSGSFAAIVLFRVRAALSPALRVVQRLCAAAVTVGTAAFATVGALVLAGAGTGTARGAVAAVGFGTSAVLLAIALLRAPTVVAPASRVALALDGTLFTLGILYVVWAGFLHPWHRRMADGVEPARVVIDCLVFALPLVLNAVVVGMVVVSAVHLARLRSPALLGCAGVGLFGVGGSLLTVAAGGRGGGTVLAAGALALIAGAGGLALRAHRGERAPARRARATNPTWLSAAAIMLAMGATVVRLATGVPLDPVSIAVAVLIGGFLTAQQWHARVAIARIADRLAQSEAHFRAMAHTDALTGLANRRELLRVLAEEASGGPACVLLAIDLDGFKNINDIRGHDVGDAVLVEVARRLRANVRPGDCAARLGGDEFAVLLWARPTEARSLARRILAVLNRPFELATGTLFVTASVGLAGCLEADSIDSLLRNADLALRFAKQSGKNRIEAYDVAYDQLVSRRTVLEHELREATGRGELTLVYQPVVDVGTGTVVGVEALLRWHHPQLGSVSPVEFIPVAEESGLIHGIGAFVVHEAAHQLARWLADGHELWMSVNASVRELLTPGYPQRIVEVLRAHRVPPERLTVEVTEHAAAQDAGELIDRLVELRADGVRVALDDFGSEYSSLKLLRTLPVDSLKIDRELLDGDRQAQAPIVDAVVTIGHRLGLDVVAEGVSTAAQRALLVGYGCRYAQGELFGAPMPAERVETLFGRDAPFRDVGEVDSRREIRQG
jgi:diguanylate cyclase (GGDEF)-like protein